MTRFATKKMSVREWSAVQDKVAQLQIALGAPHDLMMFIAEPHPPTGDQEIIIGFPDSVPLGLFPGFIEIQRGDIPQISSTLVIRGDGFNERFPDISAKFKKLP